MLQFLWMTLLVGGVLPPTNNADGGLDAALRRQVPIVVEKLRIIFPTADDAASELANRSWFAEQCRLSVNLMQGETCADDDPEALFARSGQFLCFNWRCPIGLCLF